MKKPTIPHWIKHSHLLSPDEYECSECGAVFRRKSAICPKCGATLRPVLDRQEWLDEAVIYEIMDDD